MSYANLHHFLVIPPKSALAATAILFEMPFFTCVQQSKLEPLRGQELQTGCRPYVCLLKVMHFRVVFPLIKTRDASKSHSDSICFQNVYARYVSNEGLERIGTGHVTGAPGL